METDLENDIKLENLIKDSTTLLEKVNYDNYFHRYAVSVFFPMVSITSGYLNLYRADILLPARLLLRTLFEKQADLINLHKNPSSYILQLEANRVIGKLKIINNAKKNDGINPMLNRAYKLENLQIIEENLKNMRDYLKILGCNTNYTSKERFNDAGLNSIYDSVYWLFSNHTHGNLIANESYFIKSDYSLDIQQVCYMLNQANLIFKDLLNIPNDEYLDRTLEKLLSMEKSK